jgi:GDP/UDP-N,N'-diacetylbacillosamine 2-epimerase (hydrolysing)
MSEKRKACIVTGTRAEYGLLYWLMKEIEASTKLELQIIVTGMHLSSEFGLTYQQIEKDGFTINKKVEMLLSSDSEVGITKSMGLGLIGFADALNDLSPDLIVVLGDRFEILAAVTAAMISKIPVAHLHGGEATEGAFDESIRHSITKMSHLHFTATEEYRKRVVQLGERPTRVFNVGAIGIDNIKRLQLLSKGEFEEAIQFKLANRNLLVTFHPVTLENATSQEQFNHLLNALNKLEETNIFFTKSNADTDGRVINRMIDSYVTDHPERSIAFDSLGQLRYLSAMLYVDGVVGNSSSGLLEAPSFKIGTINIGDRQKGRIQATSVIDCLPTEDDITKALKKLFSREFNESLTQTTSPFGNGGVAEKITKIIEDTNLDGIIKKSFYDKH